MCPPVFIVENVIGDTTKTYAGLRDLQMNDVFIIYFKFIWMPNTKRTLSACFFTISRLIK